jgi:hypothetical protein
MHEGETYDRTMHDDDGMRMTIRYYYDDERATPDSRDTC